MIFCFFSYVSQVATVYECLNIFGNVVIDMAIPSVPAIS